NNTPGRPRIGQSVFWTAESGTIRSRSRACRYGSNGPSSRVSRAGPACRAGFRLDVAGKAGQIASHRVGDDTARGTGHAALLAALVGDDEAAGAPVQRAGDTLQTEIVADQGRRLRRVAAGVHEQQAGRRLADEIARVGQPELGLGKRGLAVRGVIERLVPRRHGDARRGGLAHLRSDHLLTASSCELMAAVRDLAARCRSRSRLRFRSPTGAAEAGQAARAVGPTVARVVAHRGIPRAPSSGAWSSSGTGSSTRCTAAK